MSSEVVLEVAALATVLGEEVEVAVAITVAAVDAVVVALDAVVVAKIFLAFCVLWIWA